MSHATHARVSRSDSSDWIAMWTSGGSSLMPAHGRGFRHTISCHWPEVRKEDRSFLGVMVEDLLAGAMGSRHFTES